MYLEKLNIISKAKGNNIVSINKISNYESKTTGVVASDFYDYNLKSKIRVVVPPATSDLRNKLKIAEFVLRISDNGIRTLLLVDKKEKHICIDTRYDNITRNKYYKTYAKVRRLFKKFLK